MRARARLSMCSSLCAAIKGRRLKLLWPASLLALSIVLVALFNTCPSCNSDAVWLSLHPSSSSSLIAPEFAHIPKPELGQQDKAVYHLEEPHLTATTSQEPHDNSSDYDLGQEKVDSSLNASSEYSPHILEVVDSDDSDSEVRTDKAENVSLYGEFRAPLVEHRSGLSEGCDSPEALKMEQGLLAAKQAIASAVVKADMDLHAPLYHNLTTFIKSYELMEQNFQIYAYKDGRPPLVHTGPTVGIYASEGRFIRQLQSSKRFLTSDPKKAHLFFMPYSVTNMGPATARENPELRRSSIKVVCNADEKEEFVIGKDVSLPETSLRAAKPPTKLGGPPIRKRPYLAFFAGQMHGRVRPALLRHWKDKDKDMKIYEKIPAAIAKKTTYNRHMRMSKFCICPMGYEVNSPRIVEAIYYDCVPVIIADNFVLPFSEVLNWQAFSVSVAERDVPNLKQILLSIPNTEYITMQANLKHVRQHFSWHYRLPVKYDVFYMILHSLWLRRLASVSVNIS